MRIAIIGSGGREHAICQKIYESKKVKKIFLDNLNYWNVELQEPYFSYVEANLKRENLNKK